MRALLASLVAALALGGIAEGSEYPAPVRATQAASVFAQQPVTIECVEQDSYGYVYPSVPVIHLRPILCQRLSEMESGDFSNVGLWTNGLAVLALVHEAYHLRLNWSARLNEAQVECKAIRHVTAALGLLGIPHEHWAVLRQQAIFAHWYVLSSWWAHTGKSPYFLKTCKVPRP